MPGGMGGGGPMMPNGGSVNPLLAAIGRTNPADHPQGNPNAEFTPPTISIPDTLEASLANANRHLVLVSRGQEPLDERSLAPQIETMMALMKSLGATKGENAGESD